MAPKILFTLSTLFGGLGVTLGAFGSHYLKSRLAHDMLVVFEVGIRYQMYHVFALFVAAWASSQFPSMLFTYAGYAFLAGITLFSGSLYLLAITGMRSLGVITPIGGLFLLLGWTLLSWGFLKA